MDALKILRHRKGLSQAQLAESLGISQAQIARIERGEREPSMDLARKLSAFFEVSLDVVIGGQALSLDLSPNHQPIAEVQPIMKLPPRFMDDVDRMPVYASAEGGEGHLIVSTDEIDRVPRPYTLEGIPEAYAILVTGESMVPAYRPGDYAWVNPRLPPMKGEDCILYSIGEDGEAVATIKEMSSWNQTAWTVRQHNPARSFPLDRRIWNKHHRVVGNFRRR